MHIKNIFKLFGYFFGFVGFHWLLVPAFSFHECMYYEFCTQWPQFSYAVALTFLGVSLYKNYTVVVISLILLVALSIFDLVRAGELDIISMIESTLHQGFIYGGFVVAFIFYIFKNYYVNKNA